MGPTDTVPAFPALISPGRADSDCCSPGEPQHCPCYQGGGGAPRVSGSLTLGGRGLPGGGAASAETWTVSQSRQVQGEGGPKLAVAGSFLFIPGALGSPCRAWSQEVAPSDLCLQTAPGLPRCCARSVLPVVHLRSVIQALSSHSRCIFYDDRTSPLAYWDPSLSLCR